MKVMDTPQTTCHCKEIEGPHLHYETDTPIELPVTALGEVAELLLEIQRDLGDIHVALLTGGLPRTAGSLIEAMEKLMQAGLLVDVIRGDGQ